MRDFKVNDVSAIFFLQAFKDLIVTVEKEETDTGKKKEGNNKGGKVFF